MYLPRDAVAARRQVHEKKFNCIYAYTRIYNLFRRHTVPDSWRCNMLLLLLALSGFRNRST